jgi:signal transduction histidine kinase
MTSRNEPRVPPLSTEDADERSSPVRNAVLRFVLGSVAALIIVGLGTAYVASQVAQDQALREARYRAQLLAQEVAAPLVDESVRSRDPAALARVEAAMRSRMKDGALRHVKLWAADGEVLWADEKQLIGKKYTLEEDVEPLFGTRDATADVSTLNKKENIAERDERELLEVYAGARDADGVPIVFEAYLPLDDLRRTEIAIVSGVLAVGLGGLLLFQAAVLPMAVGLARRVQRSHAERTKMVRHALDASELERRRIAEDLHDGVIQDMAGIAFALPTLETQLVDGPAGHEARQTLRTVTDLVHKDSTTLRTMLVDLYPPDLEGAGLEMAVQDLASGVKEHGVTVTTDFEPDLDVPLEVATLTYRVIREGLRNVVKHADASTAVVGVRRQGGVYVVTVSDDGRGPGEAKEVEPGHFGLQLLADTVHDLGGEVTLEPGAESGAVLRATIPADLVR